VERNNQGLYCNFTVCYITISLLPLILAVFPSPVLCTNASVDTSQHITTRGLLQYSYANSCAERTKPRKKWVTVEPGEKPGG